MTFKVPIAQELAVEFFKCPIVPTMTRKAKSKVKVFKDKRPKNGSELHNVARAANSLRFNAPRTKAVPRIAVPAFFDR